MISLELHNNTRPSRSRRSGMNCGARSTTCSPTCHRVNPPQVRDDFSDVFGFFLLLTGGLQRQELRDFADYLRRELVLLLPGWARSAWPACARNRCRWKSRAAR